MTAQGQTATASELTEAENRLRIDLLYLDLATCTRCRGADRNLESALASVREVLAATGTEVEFNKIHVDSAERARELRFESSPTIRVNGRDVALELRESSCGSEACTDGCGDSIACRVWVYDGEEHVEPPPAMITEALLGASRGEFGGARNLDEGPFELPENLERFFAGKAEAIESETPVEAADSMMAGCCSAAEQHSCCAPEDKGECCGAPGGGRCGCR